MQRTANSASVRLGVAIRLRRRRLALTLQDLADKVGIDVSQLSKIERGCERTSVDAYEEIAKHLGVSLPRLLAPRSPRRSAA